MIKERRRMAGKGVSGLHLRTHKSSGVPTALRVNTQGSCDANMPTCCKGTGPCNTPRMFTNIRLSARTGRHAWPSFERSCRSVRIPPEVRKVYTGAEIRQHPDGTIELTQEAHVDQMEFAAVPGKGSDPVILGSKP